MSLSRRLSLLLAALGLVAALAASAGLGQSLGDRKRTLDSRIAGLEQKIERAKVKEGALTTEIAGVTRRIRALEGDIGVLNEKLSALEGQLAIRRERLARLKELYALQTRRLRLLTRQHAEAQRRLELRLVDLYQTDQPDELSILVLAESLNDLIEQVQLFSDIARQDQRIAAEIKDVRLEMRDARRQTAAVKEEVAEATRVLAAKTAEERAARDQLVSQQQQLDSARSSKQELLASVREHRHEAEEDLEAMKVASSRIMAQIQAAQARARSSGSSGGGGGGGAGALSTASGTPSASGFIWPVSGVLTSRFGWRWGRMHEGIDIAAPAGTPIYSVAAGTVIYAGWMGGYGNITIVDHGGGIATAYAHQSATYVTSGSVGQGQAIGAVGTTGRSTGNHLHFEVRVNGRAVDPLGYL